MTPESNSHPDAGYQAARGVPLVTVIVPLWNEEESIGQLVERLRRLRDVASVRWEFVFVNDGSTDGTRERLVESADALGAWALVQLSRNFGQQPAYRAGLDVAAGNAVVFLDADLQDPPELIPEMIERWKAGAKLIVGRRKSRAETGLRRKFFDLFHTLFFHLTAGAMPRDSGTFGLMDRAVADQVRAMPEVNLFLPAQRCWVGFRQEVVWYDRALREGAPKQSWAKLFSYAWEGITSFSVLPLKAISLVGVVVSLGGFAYAGLLVGVKILQLFGLFPALVVQGFTTLAVALFFLGGIQLVCLGLIGEYLAKVYREVKRRPIYIVEEVLRSNPPKPREP